MLFQTAAEIRSTEIKNYIYIMKLITFLGIIKPKSNEEDSIKENTEAAVRGSIKSHWNARGKYL